MKRFFAELIPQAGPERILGLGTFINTFGNGLFTVVEVMYFTRIVGLSAHQVGITFTVAGAIGLLFSVPGGHLADRISPRNVSVVVSLVSAVLIACVALVDSFQELLLVTVLLAITDRAGNSMRQALIARVGGPEGRVRLRALLRSVTNVGIGLGASVGGIALTIDTKSAYIVVIVANAIVTALAALNTLRLADIEPLPAAAANKMTLALRDRPFVTLTAINGALTLHFMLLEIALPLWITLHTQAPRWVVALVFVINTAVVALFQIRFSRGSEDIRHAATTLARASRVLALACLVYASATLVDNPWLASLILVAGALVHVYGELQQAAGSWGIGFGLPPEHAQGQYQGVWSLGFAGAGMIGPLFLTGVVIAWGIPGWTLLGLLFVIAGLLVRPVTEWALRSGPRATVTT